MVVAENDVVESSSDPELENVPLMASENQAAASTMQQVLYFFRKKTREKYVMGLWNFMKIAQICCPTPRDDGVEEVFLLAPTPLIWRGVVPVTFFCFWKVKYLRAGI